MLRNYFKIALRNLQKNTIYSFINITGLSIGIACSMLIFLWVADEYSYDTHHANYDRIYKVLKSETWAQGIGTGPAMPYPLKDAIKDKSSNVKHIAMTNWGEGNMLQVGEKRLNKLGLSASEDFFKIFSFNMMKGDPNTALNEPNSIVITESTAKIFFNETDPINQLIKIDNEQELKVTGVIKDMPKQSAFQFDYVLPFSYFESTAGWVRNARNNWNNNSFLMYVELQPGGTEADVTTSIKDLVKDNNPKAPTAQVFLHHISKWRLYSNFENGKNTGGMIEYVQLFTAIAIFVLIIACINFMNLATARSESRAREVGIRKSVGSRRKDLIFQFLGESVLITFISSLVSFVLVELVLPFYNTLVNKNITIDYSNPWLWVIATGWVLVIGITSGSYPAFYLSAFQPVKVLKGKVNVGKGASTPRKVLVTLQFGFSIFLIIGTIVIYQQIMHVKSRDMGYDRENLIQIWTNNELETNFQSVRTELERTGVVASICKSNSPITAIFSNNEVKWEGMPEGGRVGFSTVATEFDYTKTMGIELLDGRDFSREFNDSLSVIINQAAVDFMGMKDPLGKNIEYNKEKLTIVGVMKDVVMGSPYQPVEPLTLIFAPDWSTTISLRLTKPLSTVSR
jgi:putative ABC transport system permease protein